MSSRKTTVPKAGLCVKKISGKGRGVFTERGFKSGEVIEQAPVLKITSAQWQKIKSTIFKEYCFTWGKEGTVLAFGFGSLYNHSYRPNAMTYEDVKAGVLTIVALSDIGKGKEVTINYNGDPGNKDELWFSVKGK